MGSHSNSGGRRRASRRQFLELIVASAGSVGLLACGSADEAGSASLPTETYFPQSIASGDPRPSSVVLWTRVVDPARPDTDLVLELEVSPYEDFRELVPLDGEASLPLVARADFDGCVKVRVTGLEADRTYHYRFRYRAAEGVVTSRPGRTRTAPEPDADRTVRFSVMSCQDYGGHYYHCYRHLLEQEVDFIVHLGDYVYETVGDPAFQDPNAERKIAFGRPEEALTLPSRGEVLAARSLDNYRDLYRTVRSDPDLQAVHERIPMIAVWDDHEYSDDCHGATATYTDGREDEHDLARRRAADRAWFEYMPVDFDEAPAAALDADREFPDDFAIYRSFGFGRHLELVLTDLRRHRPDHLVPEDAFPGALLLTEDEVGDAPAERTVPYIDVDEYADGQYAAALREGAGELGIDAERVSGFLSIPWINAQLATLGDDAPVPIDPESEDFPRGYAVHQLLKTAEYARLGARYLVALDPLLAVAARRFAETEGASERLMGEAQRAWFLDTLRRSTRTFKVWGSPIAFMPKVVDVRSILLLPPELRARYVLSADDWDGFPNERQALLAELSEAGNVAIVSGDLHCFLVGTPFDAEEPSRRVVEFCAGAVSSLTWAEGIERLAAADPSIPEEFSLIAPAVGALLTDRQTRANPHLAFHELGKNGYAVLSVSGEALEAELFLIDPRDVATPPDALTGELASRFKSVRFRVPADSGALERLDGSGVARWDTDEMDWVVA